MSKEKGKDQSTFKTIGEKTMLDDALDENAKRLCAVHLQRARKEKELELKHPEVDMRVKERQEDKEERAKERMEEREAQKDEMHVRMMDMELRNK